MFGVVRVAVGDRAYLGADETVVGGLIGVIPRPVVAVRLMLHLLDVAHFVVSVALSVLAHRQRVAGAQLLHESGVTPVVFAVK